MTNAQAIQTASSAIRALSSQPVDVAVILGSGLGSLAETFDSPQIIPFSDIPHFPPSGVEGHAGQLILATLSNGKRVACLQGRYHFYEGYALDQVVLPVRVMRALGAKTLVVTNAAGGIKRDFVAGDLMLIEDHINFTGQNPLIGPNDNTVGPRFLDMSETYTPRLKEIVLNTAQQLNINLQRGVYLGLTGPSYETPAEIRMMRALGADAVGMSTVLEVIAAAHLEMKILGLSCITNAAAGNIAGHKLNHEEVLIATEQAKSRFTQLLKTVLPQI